jgi:hypothetical protein
MSPTSLFAVQFTFSLLLSTIVAGWYIGPALKKLSLDAALVPLFLFEASAVLALLAALSLRYKVSGAIAIAWVVNVVTSLDWLYASFLAASNQLVTYPMGANWYIINYYVPAIGVAHVLFLSGCLRAIVSGLVIDITYRSAGRSASQSALAQITGLTKAVGTAPRWSASRQSMGILTRRWGGFPKRPPPMPPTPARLSPAAWRASHP